VRARGGGGRTGPSPIDRRKRGSKHQIIADAGGIPLVADTTAANVPDVNPMIPLVDAIPPVRGKPGRPRRRPASLYGDRGYDSDPHRRKLRRRGIRPYIARPTADAAWERAGNVSLVRGADAVVVAQLREAASSQG
jgi:Transposase DDE domain